MYTFFVGMFMTIHMRIYGDQKGPAARLCARRASATGAGARQGLAGRPGRRPTPGPAGSDGPSERGGARRPRPPYWFQEYWAGAISPPLPVIHPPRARAKEAPLFVFQQLTPSAVDEQA